MRLLTPTLALLLLLLGAPKTALGARYTLPLPAADLPAGTLTVKVVGAGMKDHKVGQRVEVHAVAGAPKSAVTGDDGRARFDGLTPGATVTIVVKVGDGVHRSAPFAVPTSGGLRMLLTLGGGDGPPQAGGQPGAMPPGHPPVGEGAKPQPTGAATIEEVAQLDKGQLTVRVVKGRAKKPQAGVSVRLIVSGAPAGAIAKTAASGEATLQLPEGATSGVVAEISHAAQTLRSRPLLPPKQGGLRATFVVHDSTADRSKLILAPGTHWVAQVGEQVVRFMQVLQLATKDDLIVDPGRAGLTLPLPRGAEGVEVPEQHKGILSVDQEGGPLLLRAPVPPDGLTVRFYFTLPYSGDRLAFRQRATLDSPPSLVALVNGEGVKIEGPSVAGAPQGAIITGGVRYPLSPTAKGEEVSFELVNLPHHDELPLMLALGVAGLIVLWALIAALGGPQRAAALQRRREQLLQQLQAARRSKKGDRKRQELLRQELLALWDEPW